MKRRTSKNEKQQRLKNFLAKLLVFATILPACLCMMKGHSDSVIRVRTAVYIPHDALKPIVEELSGAELAIPTSISLNQVCDTMSLNIARGQITIGDIDMALNHNVETDKTELGAILNVAAIDLQDISISTDRQFDSEKAEESLCASLQGANQVALLDGGSLNANLKNISLEVSAGIERTTLALKAPVETKILKPIQVNFGSFFSLEIQPTTTIDKTPNNDAQAIEQLQRFANSVLERVVVEEVNLSKLLNLKFAIGKGDFVELTDIRGEVTANNGIFVSANTSWRGKPLKPVGPAPCPQPRAMFANPESTKAGVADPEVLLAEFESADLQYLTVALPQQLANETINGLMQRGRFCYQIAQNLSSPTELMLTGSMIPSQQASLHINAYPTKLPYLTIAGGRNDSLSIRGIGEGRIDLKTMIKEDHLVPLSNYLVSMSLGSEFSEENGKYGFRFFRDDTSIDIRLADKQPFYDAGDGHAPMEVVGPIIEKIVLPKFDNLFIPVLDRTHVFSALTVTIEDISQAEDFVMIDLSAKGLRDFIEGLTIAGDPA